MLDFEKIYKKDHKENIKLFSDLKSNKKYSVYSTELNKFFGENSYDNFSKDLKEHKRIHYNYFKKMFEKPVVKGEFKKFEKPFNVDEFNNSLKNMRLKHQKLEDKMKQARHSQNYSPFRKYKENMDKSKGVIEKIFIPEIPDLGRYNPNYESIRTHSYYPVFATSDFINYNKDKSNVYAHQLFFIKDKDNESFERNKKEVRNRNIRDKSIIDHSETEPNNNDTSIDKSQNQSSIKNNDLNVSDYMSTSSFGVEKNNHCLKFDSYSQRKPIIRPGLNNTEFLTNYTNYYQSKYIRGNVDFNKISSNPHICSYFDEVAKKNNNPPLGMYKPNYNSVLKKPVVNIYLNKKDPPSPKLAKLKKIIYSYDVSKEYKMISTLNDHNKNKSLLNITK